MDHAHLAASLRSIRLRMGLRQADLARLARVSPGLVSRMERGQIGRMHLDDLTELANALEVRIDVVPTWRGGAVDRILNARHSALHEILAVRLARLCEWDSGAEVSYSIYGERGVIDRLAFHRRTGALVVFELKTELTDPAGLVAQVDRYRRLAPRIARERGWILPAHATVSCWAIVADTRSNRRRLAAHWSLLRGAFPADGRMLGAWLADPAERVDGLGFMPYPSPLIPARGLAATKRVHPGRVAGAAPGSSTRRVHDRGQRR